jgi:hypothetical protein
MTGKNSPALDPTIKSSTRLVLHPTPEPRDAPVDDNAPPIRGVLDAIIGRIVEGWAADPTQPDQPVTVEIFADDRWLGSAVAMSYREDLEQAGLGTGHHHFNFLLPIELFDGNPHLISARPRGCGKNLDNSPMQLAGAGPAEIPQAARAHGMLDVITEDGWVEGWAWYPAARAHRVAIEILVDGVVAGSTLAALHRADLAAAGIGDGNYGFSFALPYEIVARARESMVAVRERDSSQVLGAPRLFRRRAVADALEKLGALEDDVRFLRAAHAHTNSVKTESEREAAALFRTVGDFFVQLAETAESGRPLGNLRTLRDAVADITSQHAPLTFDYPAAPALSFCIEARGSAAAVHATLQIVHDMAAGRKAEVVLFDSGACDDTPLLPLVAKNIRYLRTTGGGMAAAFNQAAAFARGHVLVFMASNAAPLTYWLDNVLNTFETDETLAIMGAKIELPDGVLAHAGSKQVNGRKTVLGFGHNPAEDAFSLPRPIDGVAPDAFAVRAQAWRDIGGLDEGLDGLEKALDEFCARAAAHGGRILFNPAFSFVLNDLAGAA